MLHNPYLLKRFGCSQPTNQICEESEIYLSMNRNMNDNKGSAIDGLQQSTNSFCVGPNCFVNNCVNSNREDEEYDASINFSRFPNSSYMKMSVFKPSTSSKKTKESTTYENSTNSYSNKLINNIYINHNNDFQKKLYRNSFKENDKNNINNKYNSNNNQIQYSGKQNFLKVWQEECCRKQEDEVNCNDKSDLHTPPQKVFPLNDVMSCLASGNCAHSNDDSFYANYNVASSNSKKVDHATSTLSSSLPPLHPSEQSYLNCNIQHRTSLKKSSISSDNNDVNEYINHTKVEKYIRNDSNGNSRKYIYSSNNSSNNNRKYDEKENVESSVSSVNGHNHVDSEVNSESSPFDDRVSQTTYELNTTPKNNYYDNRAGAENTIVSDNSSDNYHNQRSQEINVNDNSIDALQMWKEEQEEVSTNKVDENFVNDNSNTNNNTLVNQNAFVRAATRTDQTCKVKSNTPSKEDECKELDFCDMHSDEETQNKNTLLSGVYDEKSKQNFDAFMNSLLGESQSVLSNANELLKQSVDRVGEVNDEVKKKISGEYNLPAVKDNRESNVYEQYVNEQHCQSERSNANINDDSNNNDEVFNTDYCTYEKDRPERVHSFVLNPPATLSATLKEKIQWRIGSTAPSTTSTLLPNSSSSSEKVSRSYKEDKIFEMKPFNVDNCKERFEEKCRTSISSLDSANTEHQQRNFKVDCQGEEISHNVYTANDVNETDDIYFVSPASNDIEYNSFPMEKEDENKQQVERNALRSNNQNNNYRGQIPSAYNTEQYYDGDEVGALHSSKLISKLTVKLTSNPERIMECRLRHRGNLAERSRAQDQYKQELCCTELFMPCNWGNNSNNYVEHVRSANEEHECQENLLECKEKGEIWKSENKKYELRTEPYPNTNTHILPWNTQRSFQENVEEDRQNEQDYYYYRNKYNSVRITNDVNKGKLKNCYCNHSMLNSKMPNEIKADESRDNDEEYDAEKKYFGESAKMHSITPESNIDSLMHKLMLFLQSDSKCKKYEEERKTGNYSTFNSASQDTEQLCTRNKIHSANSFKALTEQQSIPHNSDLLQRELQLCDSKNRNSHCEEKEKQMFVNEFDDNSNVESLPPSMKSFSPNKTSVEILEHDVIKNNNSNNINDGNKQKNQEKKNEVKGKAKIEHGYTAPTQSSARKTVVRKSKETYDIFALSNSFQQNNFMT